MTNKSALSIVGILLLYALVALLIFEIPIDYLTSTGVAKPQKFIDLFQQNAYIVLGASFVGMLIWFVAGEWIIQPFAASRTWYLTWILLFTVVLATAVYMSFQGPLEPKSHDPVNYDAAAWYLGTGLLSFYLASVLFSPTSAQYVIWPAKHVRRW